MLLGQRPMSDWIRQYAESHQHPVNRWCHTLGIPMIVVSLVVAAGGRRLAGACGGRPPCSSSPAGCCSSSATPSRASRPSSSRTGGSCSSASAGGSRSSGARRDASAGRGTAARDRRVSLSSRRRRAVDGGRRGAARGDRAGDGRARRLDGAAAARRAVPRQADSLLLAAGGVDRRPRRHRVRGAAARHRWWRCSGAAAIGWLVGAMFGATIGLWAAICYATMLLPFAVSLSPLHDLVMVPLVTVAIGAFWHARHDGVGAARWPRWTLRRRGRARPVGARQGPDRRRPGRRRRRGLAGVDAGAVVRLVPSPAPSRWPSRWPSPGRGTRRWSAPCPAISTTSSWSGTSAASPTTRSGTPAGRSCYYLPIVLGGRAGRGRCSLLWRRGAPRSSDGERLLWAGWSADVRAAQPGRLEAGHLRAAGDAGRRRRCAPLRAMRCRPTGRRRAAGRCRSAPPPSRWRCPRCWLGTDRRPGGSTSRRCRRERWLSAPSCCSSPTLWRETLERPGAAGRSSPRWRHVDGGVVVLPLVAEPAAPAAAAGRADQAAGQRCRRACWSSTRASARSSSICVPSCVARSDRRAASSASRVSRSATSPARPASRWRCRRPGARRAALYDFDERAADPGAALPGAAARRLPPPLDAAALTLRRFAASDACWRHGLTSARAALACSLQPAAVRSTSAAAAAAGSFARRPRRRPANPSDGPRAQLEGEWTLVGFETPAAAVACSGFLRYDRFANIAVHAELAPDEPGGAAAADRGRRFHGQGHRRRAASSTTSACRAASTRSG